MNQVQVNQKQQLVRNAPHDQRLMQQHQLQPVQNQKTTDTREEEATKGKILQILAAAGKQSGISVTLASGQSVQLRAVNSAAFVPSSISQLSHPSPSTSGPLKPASGGADSVAHNVPPVGQQKMQNVEPQSMRVSVPVQLAIRGQHGALQRHALTQQGPGGAATGQLSHLPRTPKQPQQQQWQSYRQHQQQQQQLHGQGVTTISAAQLQQMQNQQQQQQQQQSHGQRVAIGAVQLQQMQNQQQQQQQSHGQRVAISAVQLQQMQNQQQHLQQSGQQMQVHLQTGHQEMAQMPNVAQQENTRVIFANPTGVGATGNVRNSQPRARLSLLGQQIRQSAVRNQNQMAPSQVIHVTGAAVGPLFGVLHPGQQNQVAHNGPSVQQLTKSQVPVPNPGQVLAGVKEAGKQPSVNVRSVVPVGAVSTSVVQQQHHHMSQTGHMPVTQHCLMQQQPRVVTQGLPMANNVQRMAQNVRSQMSTNMPVILDTINNVVSTGRGNVQQGKMLHQGSGLEQIQRCYGQSTESPQPKTHGQFQGSTSGAQPVRTVLAGPDEDSPPSTPVHPTTAPKTSNKVAVFFPAGNNAVGDAVNDVTTLLPGTTVVVQRSDGLRVQAIWNGQSISMEG